MSFTGRVWRDDDQLGKIELLRELGARLRFTAANDSPVALPAAKVFDRQVLAFGAPMQALLANLHIGVVGAGGTGLLSANS